MASAQLQELMGELGAMAADYFQALGPPMDIARMRAAMRPVARWGVVPATVSAVPVHADGVPCEWVCDAASDPDHVHPCNSTRFQA